MLLRFRSLSLAVLLLSSVSFAQQQVPLPAETALQAGIKKAYTASVRMWGYDTVTKRQNSAQFSGVVVSSDGYILTVAHAIQPGHIYKVSFPDGRQTLASGLGRIELAENKGMPDVAMMQILGHEKWPYAPMAWSHAIKKGDPCFSIAYPESLSQLLPDIRFGFVVMPEMSSGFIHTSCAMEVGDSGGPLFDIKGHVIGLNSRCDVSEEWNYQVPVDLYRKYWSSLSLMENYTSFPYRSDSIGRPAVADTAQSPFIVPAQAAIPYKGASCQVVSNQEDGKQQSTGATVLAAGMYLKDKNASGTYLISKSSCIGDKPMVQLPSGKKTGADIIARSIQQDLVLLYVKEKIPGGVSLDTSYGTSPNTGAFLYSLLPDGQQKRGIAGSQPFYLPAKFSGGYFGANATFKGGAVTLTSIQPNSPVIPAGLQLEDKILSINHVSLNKPEDYGSELMKHFPHEKITLEVKRQDSLFEKEVTLGTRTERKSAHLAEQFEGGKSSRRDGFANVFLYDGRIKADECGAPVFDAQGRCRGMAIARFSRTATLVMPVADIVKWLHQLNS